MGLFEITCQQGHAFAWWTGGPAICPFCVPDSHKRAEMHIAAGFPDPRDVDEFVEVAITERTKPSRTWTQVYEEDAKLWEQALEARK